MTAPDELFDANVLQNLLTEAEQARNHAYVPYSGFDAGAAVRTRSGNTYGGAVVENLIFGLSMCAERVAMFHAAANGDLPIVAIALAAPSTAGKTTTPCGSCLQLGIELGSPQTIVVTPDDDETLTIASIDDLAPGIPRRGDA